MSAVAETAVVFLGVSALAPWALIGAGKLKTPQGTRAPRSTAGAVQATEPAAPVAQSIEAVRPPAPTTLELVAVGSGVRDKKTGRFVRRDVA